MLRHTDTETEKLRAEIERYQEKAQHFADVIVNTEEERDRYSSRAEKAEAEVERLKEEQHPQRIALEACKNLLDIARTDIKQLRTRAKKLEVALQQIPLLVETMPFVAIVDAYNAHEEVDRFRALAVERIRKALQQQQTKDEEPEHV